MTKFRELTSETGKLILAGKSAKNNEELIKQVGSEEEVFHTEKPGSPFVNIKGRPAKEDIKFAAIFCARYSQDWRDNKKDVIVHRFKGKDIHKEKEMKLGTFGVKKLKKIKIKKEDIEQFEKCQLKEKSN
jgi:predicted ribosome quality control (RQC) complex YloA/Tae2 family protein